MANNYKSEGLYNMYNRLQYEGGTAQQDRMIRDKRKTLDRVVLYSYQGAQIHKLDSTDTVRALINPNKLKQDYDDKVLSVGFEYNFQPGDVFEWNNTNTKWLIYLQDLTELAYFKGDIRKCKHTISWKDEAGVTHTTYAAVRGPVETQIDSIQKNQLRVNNPNYTLNILMPKNADTLDYFKRYSKFYLRDLSINEQDICWRVTAIDSISMPGILEINAREYYINEFEDDTEHGIAGGLIVEPVEPEPQDKEIAGPTFIKPKITYEFIYSGTEEINWQYDTKLPIRASIDGNKISIYWNSTYCGQFVLKCGSAEKTIVVESLF